MTDSPPPVATAASAEISGLRTEMAGFRAEIQTLRSELYSQGRLLERMDERQTNMAGKLEEITKQMVTRPEFTYVKAIAIGFAALALSAVAWAILNNVVPGS